MLNYLIIIVKIIHLYDLIDINDKEILPKNIVPVIDEYFEKLCEYVSKNIV